MTTSSPQRLSLDFLLNPTETDRGSGSMDDLTTLQSSVQFTFSSPKERGVFSLREEPFEIQRKSYKNENRYLRPHPLVVQHRGLTPVDGWIEVSVVSSSGEAIPSSEQDNILECNGGRKHSIRNSHCARLSIKINREGAFRLRFHLYYVLANKSHFEELLYSRPFVVRANQRNIQIAPLISAYFPASGPAGTEIWIKGKGYSSSKTVVTFNNVVAKIQEVKKTLIVVKAPSGFPPGPVVVQVSNVYKGTTLNSKIFNFTYLQIESPQPLLISHEHFQSATAN